MDSVLFAGAQDQGTQRYRGEQTCYEGPLGDGGGVAVDPNNPRQVMRQYVNAGLSVSTDAGSSGNWSGLDFPPVGASPSKPQLTAKSTENSSTAFYSPIAVTPIGVSPTLTAFGTNRLWLTPDWGSTWTTLLRWLRLFGQFFRFDEWSLCRVRLPSGLAAFSVS
jgi:hypothetical protein